MKSTKIVFLFLVVFLALSSIFLLRQTKADVVKSKYFNYVEKGAKVVKTSPSTQYKLMETYPQATVTVYNAGTTDLASIWADRDGFIIKANPFTADTDSFYYFYVDCGKYDIKFSGTGISIPYTYGDVAICGSVGSGTGNVSTLGGTTDFIPKWTSSTSLGDSVLYNPLNVQAGSTTLFGWTSGVPTSSLDVAIGRNSTGKVEINSGTLNDLANLTLHRIEPIPTATIPGLNFGTIADDPSSPVLGDCWYNTSLSAFRCFNGSTVTLSTGSGITSINALTASAQLLVTGTSGSDFNISSSTATHTFNLPDASLTARGVVNTSSQSFNGDKIFDDTLAISTNVANSFIYSNSLKRLVTTIAPTNGQLLIGSTGAAPIVANITGDSNISIINSAGGIQITCTTCSGGSGTTINPTDTFLPYRLNATTFADSPLSRPNANTIEQYNGTNAQVNCIYITRTNITKYSRMCYGYQLVAGANFDFVMEATGGESTHPFAWKTNGGFQLVYDNGSLNPADNQIQNIGHPANQFNDIRGTHLYAATDFIFADALGGTRILNAGNAVVKFGSTTVGDGTWSGGVTTVVTINSDKDNYDPAGSAYFQRWSSDANRSITGFTRTPQVQGQTHLIVNIGNFNITLVHESASSSATNRFNTSTGADVVLQPRQAADIIRDATLDRWLVFKRN